MPTSPASRDRRTPGGLTLPGSDPLLGSDGYVAARFDNLLDLLGAVAVQSSPELSFKVAQAGTALNFTIYQPRDQSATAVFTVDRQNVSDYNWLLSHPPGNHVIAGGLNPTPGTPTGRAFAEVGNDTTASAWGFATEEFVDARSTSDPNGLVTIANGTLASDGVAPFNANLTMLDKPPVAGVGGLYFMGPGAAGYQVGDIVTVEVDGYTFQAILREVQIDLQPGALAVITPAIGTPDASIMQEYQALQTRAAAQGVTIKNLSTNY
jgi:hypothetical protein